MTILGWFMPVSFRMAPARTPLKRFMLHSLWVVLPFCALLALTWNAWRSDANTRRRRLLESAIRFSERALEDTNAGLGPWSPIPSIDRAATPPLPHDDPTAAKRYEAGDFEGVLGGPETLRSAAGLSLRSLAALQLLRKETDPARLEELASVLTNSMDFVAPLFLEEAETRFAELKLTPPPALADWRSRWQRAKAESSLLDTLDESAPASWKEIEGISYLLEINAKSHEWRVSTGNDVRSAAAQAMKIPLINLADGLAVHLSVAGKSVAGQPGLIPFSVKDAYGWKTEVVLNNEAAYLNSDRKTRNFMTAVISMASLAALFGMTQSGRAYLRAVELARRQSEFMAAVSHEMRTPLSAMGLLAENLESGVADRSGQRDEHTKLIREECARLGGLVDNVLAFTRDGRREPHEAFDAAAMIEDAASLVGPLADRKGIHLGIHVADFPEALHGDAAALRRALLNVMDNALKHTPAGGKITCHARPQDESHWTIEVTDNGPGIPVHERTRIFEPFYRIGDELRRTTPGTGIGLALVKQTAEAHGGHVQVTDAPGGGSRFTITLPYHP